MNGLSKSNSWILKSKGDESAFGGNLGYADNPASQYVYDTNVKNNDKVAVGDYIVIVDKKFISGYAVITSIDVKNGIQKIRYRCPVCNTQEHYQRKGIQPKYKCRKKHEFDVPREEHIMVNEFIANYGSTFIAAKQKTSVKLLDPYYLNRNYYYSIQQVDLGFFEKELPQVLKSLQNFEKGIASKPSSVDHIPPYSPTLEDGRERKEMDVVVRKGQIKFKNDLVGIYGPLCMLTGCTVQVAIEASHIFPYRGEKDNNPYNGLLLRADLHKLFDDDLIGINPETLAIELHPSIVSSHYKKFLNKRIKTNRKDFSPSPAALTYRWKIFQTKCQIVTLKG